MKNESKRAWDFLTEEERKKIIDEIIGYFLTEKNEEIGVVAAGNILDFFLQNASDIIYNRAIDDVKSFIEKEYSGLIMNIDTTLRKKI